MKPGSSETGSPDVCGELTCQNIIQLLDTLLLFSSFVFKLFQILAESGHEREMRSGMKSINETPAYPLVSIGSSSLFFFLINH